MQLISVVNAKNGWKIEYEDRAKDSIPVKVKYPSLSDIGLGKPTVEFLQALAKFLPIAIAVSHLDRLYWQDNGEVTGVKIKEGKDDQLIQISVEAESEESFNPVSITTHSVEFFSVMSILQAADFSNPSLHEAIRELEVEVEKYISGDRFEEQLELFPESENSDFATLPSQSK